MVALVEVVFKPKVLERAKMSKRANERIEKARQKYGVTVWMLADRYGKSENTMYRLFRHELPPAEQERIIGMIEEIAKERDHAD